MDNKTILELMISTVDLKIDKAFIKKNEHIESHSRTYWEGKYAAFREIRTMLKNMLSHET